MAEFPYSYFRPEWQLRAGVLIWQIVSPLLIIFGTTGNVISIRVLSGRKFNRWSSSVYLIALAVADMSVLYLGLLRQWVKYTFGVDFRSLNSTICKMHWWFWFSCADIPVWILIAITAERLVSTLCPYKSKRICTKNKAKVVLICIVFGALAINCHTLYGFGGTEVSAGNTTTYMTCAPLTESYEHFFMEVWTWIDLCKFSLIPFVLLTTGNICIIVKIVSIRRKIRARVQPVTSRGTGSAAASTDEKTSNMTILLISLNCVFIVCTSPVCIYLIGESSWIPKDIPREIQQQDPWWAFVNMLMYANHSANFVMYCLTGSRFRESVKDMFTRRSRANVTGSTVSTINARSAAI